MDNNIERKISVEEYLENINLLEIHYTKYYDKMEIVDTILSKIIVHDSSPRTINTAILDRVATQVFIEAITNLDLSIVDEDGLDGYDLLCYEDELNDLLSISGIANEYSIFRDILEKRINDFYNYENNIAVAINNIKKDFLNYTNSGLDYLNQMISSIDAEKVASFIEQYLPKEGVSE